jgi:hypothetical protein
MDSVDNRPNTTIGVAYFSTPILAYLDGSKNPWHRSGENDSINQCFDVDLRVPWAVSLDFSMSMNA